MIFSANVDFGVLYIVSFFCGNDKIAKTKNCKKYAEFQVTVFTRKVPNWKSPFHWSIPHPYLFISVYPIFWYTSFGESIDWSERCCVGRPSTVSHSFIEIFKFGHLIELLCRMTKNFPSSNKTCNSSSSCRAQLMQFMCDIYWALVVAIHKFAYKISV